MQEITHEEIKKLQAGDKQVFNAIMALYKNRVTGLCFKYMKNIEEARDMAQEVFCAAYTGINGFEFRSKFSTWLYRLAVNCCISRLRKLKTRRAIENHPLINDNGGDTGELERIADRRRPADEDAELKELKNMVLDVLAGFPDRERVIIILLDMESLSCAEISGLMKIPVNTVKVIASRTRQKLKKILLRKIR
jgi:RNA polymerase sigma-70 factor (ECF subfamily)